MSESSSRKSDPNEETIKHSESETLHEDSSFEFKRKREIASEENSEESPSKRERSQSPSPEVPYSERKKDEPEEEIEEIEDFEDFHAHHSTTTIEPQNEAASFPDTAHSDGDEASKDHDDVTKEKLDHDNKEENKVSAKPPLEPTTPPYSPPPSLLEQKKPLVVKRVVAPIERTYAWKGEVEMPMVTSFSGSLFQISGSNTEWTSILNRNLFVQGRIDPKVVKDYLKQVSPFFSFRPFQNPAHDRRLTKIKMNKDPRIISNPHSCAAA